MLLQKFTDDVTVSSLPHPISMFMLGIMAVTVVFLFVEYKRGREEAKKCHERIDELEKIIELSNKKVEDRIIDISKKIDSRVDKAILSIKKAG